MSGSTDLRGAGSLRLGRPVEAREANHPLPANFRSASKGSSMPAPVALVTRSVWAPLGSRPAAR